MRGTDIVAGHVGVVVHLAPVGVLNIEWTVGAAIDTADGRFYVAVTLPLRQVPHRPVRFQVIDALGLSLDELVEELPERVFAGEQTKLALHFCHYWRADDCKRCTTLVVLVKMRIAVSDIDLREYRLEVLVDHEGSHGDKFPVRELE